MYALILDNASMKYLTYLVLCTCTSIFTPRVQCDVFQVHVNVYTYEETDSTYKHMSIPCDLQLR